LFRGCQGIAIACRGDVLGMNRPPRADMIDVGAKLWLRYGMLLQHPIAKSPICFVSDPRTVREFFPKIPIRASLVVPL
jgi:hypothetical protein